MTLVSLFRATPAKYTRNRTHTEKGDTDFTLIWTERGGFQFHGEGGTMLFAAGDAAVLFNGAIGTVEVPHEEKVLAVRLNGDMLRSAVRDLDQRDIVRVRSDNMPLQLVVRYIDSLVQGRPTAPALGHLAGTHIIDLMALALQPADQTSGHIRVGALQTIRLAAIRADILAHLGEVRLSAKAVARRQGLSERYLYLLFEQSGLSFSRFVTEERLKNALRMLLDPACGGMRISDIALASGFGDLATFNRAFRRRFGNTPRAVRRGRGSEAR